MSSTRRWAATLVAGALTTATLTASAHASTDPGARDRSHHAVVWPLVLGHRGAPGYRPEHTAGGYALAASFGADYIEPDLVPTKDGYLVDRHEPEISQTTDVADHPEFAGLKTTKVVDGVPTTGWFTTDFTLAQLETLRATERIPAIRQHNTVYNGVYRIPTLQDDIDQARGLSQQYHRTIGLIPEIKHSTFFASQGLPMEQRVLDELRANHLESRSADIPIVIQSFEVSNLRWLHQRTDLPLMQLTSASGAPYDQVAQGTGLTYAAMTTPTGLRDVASYATYLGPDKNQIVPRTSTNALGTPTPLITDAHHAGLLVGPYTFRNENTFLPTDFQRGTNPADYGDALAEYRLFFELGVDAVFSDNSDTALLARQQWVEAGRPAYRGRFRQAA